LPGATELRLGQPHHDPSARYVSNPAPAAGETVSITVETTPGQEVGRTWLRSMHDGEQSWHEGTVDRNTVRFEMACGNTVNPYRFHLETSHGPRWLTGRGLLDWDPPDTWDFRLLTTGGAPGWVAERVWYQIFCDRFCSTGRHRGDSDWIRWASWDDPVETGPPAGTQLYGGDLDGILAHLDHLVGLGVGGIYLTPFFPGRSNHRYNATTFDRIDPLLGGDVALARLTEAAARAGLRVIGDLTLNHTGLRHQWFQTAVTDPASPEAGFYHFIDHPERYESWLGVASLPKLDHRSPELRRRLYQGRSSVLARYLDPPFNLDGWRIDVANMAGRLGPLDLNAEVARTARATVDEIDPGKWLVAEHFFDASLDAPGDGWHGVMNYAGTARPILSWLARPEALAALTAGPGQAERDGRQMAAAMDAVRAAMAWQVTMGSMNLLSSHDTARWRSMARTDDVALVGVGLLLCLPGAPVFLYGDEIGLTGADNEQARQPMPWSTGCWDQRFLAAYRQLIGLRRQLPALRHGGFRWVHVTGDAVMYLRETASERVLVRAARAPVEPVRLPTAWLGASEAEPLYGAERLAPVGGDLVVGGDGPAFSLWRLDPG
jgi:alpha-glucosidase